MELNEISFESKILPVLPLRDLVVFPNCITPLFVVRPKSLAALEDAIGRDKLLLATLQSNPDTDSPSAKELETIGTVCEVLQVLRVPDGSAKVLIEGQYIARSIEYTETERIIQALTLRAPRDAAKGNRGRAMMRILNASFAEYARLSEKIPDDLLSNIQKIDDPDSLINSVAHYAGLKTADKQRVLAASSHEEKFRLLQETLAAENQLLELEQKIVSQVKNQIGRSQREYFLNEQLKAIERELGISHDEDSDIVELELAIKAAEMPEEAREKAEKEVRRLSRMQSLSPEATVTRTYLEWMTEVPWKKATEDKIDLAKAEQILDRDHYGLEKIKQRILEHLAVVRLAGTTRGPILCFVGPPGVGKTSLARSIATAMGREFVRVSLGGVRDEAEIRGHRRTYIGALPGKIVQHMKKAGVVNPLFLLDEIDKMSADFRGDPASALLEVLDPEQNKAFNDHYLEVDYDLSKVMFITTANTMDGIPLPLLDRMEVIRLVGYTDLEKRHIATKYLIPRQVEAAGLKKSQVKIGADALALLISGYTKEAGVRNLEREVGSVARKIAKEFVSSGAEPGKKRKQVVVDAERLRQMLGPLPFKDAGVDRKPEIGVALGLAWTSVGGELLPVETTTMPGKGNLSLTGKLGEVMQESAKTALSHIRSRCRELGIAEDLFKDIDIHVHIPEGGIPKDGPSAGITMATSMASALAQRAVRQDIAMTGEVTLRGKVLKIGGLKEKSLAAYRLGIRQVVIPADNEDDLEDIPKEVRSKMTFLPVKTLAEVFQLVLEPAGRGAAKGKAGHPPRVAAPARSDAAGH
ncbi:MAG: endopeptidase La [Candidatus Sumerlaeia bacterium]|nr:endopeptidase La [Candidatus Sumerlaeia bacterium]